MGWKNPFYQRHVIRHWFIINVRHGWFKRCNYGKSLTLEWTTSSPPMIENWEVLPVVTHDPYDYGDSHDQSK
ncbi:hypothetical protein BMF77_02994 [Dolichospermum sp. UHCC 0315A]|nr:hypothetical protein BMF77_02994 [Dolichospermum sp. UHCC 0315A]